LFGSAFWGGLLDWMRERLVSAGTIAAADLDLITVIDDPQQVLAIMQQHRQWKRLQRQPKA
jgi:predicted Rossmann-fold nucleotide-binding protein